MIPAFVFLRVPFLNPGLHRTLRRYIFAQRKYKSEKSGKSEVRKTTLTSNSLSDFPTSRTSGLSN